MSGACGHKWEAQYLLSPTARREVVVGGTRIPVRGDCVYVSQECVERRGHDGPHRSLTNVTKENRGR